jgi:ATP-dependent Clp protease ATP-binding subunit ClpC
MDISPSMRITLGISGAEARLSGSAFLEPEHLFIAICKLEDAAEAALMFPEIGQDIAWVKKVLEDAGLSASAVRRRLRGLMRRADSSRGAFRGHRSPRCVRVCEAAEELAREEGERAVGVRHFMTTLIVDASPIAREVITALSGRWTVLREAAGLARAEKSEGAPTVAKESPRADEAPSRSRHAARARSASKTLMLDKLGRDITALARSGKLMPCVGRRGEMRQIAQILRRRTKSNPVLVGDPGVGKTCVVEGLAQRIVTPEAPAEIHNWRVVEVSMGTLLAGTCLRGEFEQRLQVLIKEAGSDPNIILFIDELHTMVGAGKGSEQGMDAAQILKPALARGGIKLIGATTSAEYRRYIESDAALERRFQMVWVNEPSKQEAVEILMGLKSKFEEHHGLVIGDDAVAKAVEFSVRYMPDHRLPDKAIDLIDQACASQMLATLSVGAGDKQTTESLCVEDIARTVAQRCRLPVDLLTADQQTRLQGMEAALKRRVIGQDHAVREVAEAVRTARLGLADPRRPAGVFLFLGPTGVGKTELAKALAEFLFGSEDALIRFDMSEYKEKHEVAKLIGAPPGYVGYHDEGQLVSKVRTRPYSVVLFDEIEKAHPEVHDIFLQVFDEGRLTDGKGRRAGFTECQIIMTSNLGCRLVQDHLQPRTRFGFHPPERSAASGAGVVPGENDKDDTLAQAVCGEVSRHFRPEFLNRIQKQVVFRPLTREALAAILARLIAQLNVRLQDKGIVVRLSPEACEKLLRDGYDAVYGARALERTVQQGVSDRLAAELLEGRIRNGDRLLVITQDDGYAFRQE